MNRRHLLAGAAALPLAPLAALASEAADDPAIGAVHRWLAANLEERAYSDPSIADDDAHAEALYDESERLWQELLGTPPQTAAGLALMLAAYAYESQATAAGCHFSDPDSWYFEAPRAGTGSCWRSGAARPLPSCSRICRLVTRRTVEAFDKALAEAEKRPYDPNGYEVRGAIIASEAAGKLISEDEAVALLKAQASREAA